MSLWAIGMPSSRPRSVPDICRASAALASASARSSVTRRNALSCGSRRRMRSRCVLASSTGDSCLAAMRRAASAMVRTDISPAPRRRSGAGSASRGSGAFTRAIMARKIAAPGRIALTWSGVSASPARSSMAFSSASSIGGVLMVRSFRSNGGGFHFRRGAGAVRFLFAATRRAAASARRAHVTSSSGSSNSRSGARQKERSMVSPFFS